jgi:hypothetical protein
MKPRPPVRAMLPSLILERRLSRIPPAAVTRLAQLAERQSEGRVDRSSTTYVYFGSTYFTFPLAQVRGAFAGRNVRGMSVGELARTLGAHPLLRLWLVRIAREEAERRIASGGSSPALGARRVESGDAARSVERSLAPGTARVTAEVSEEPDAVVIEVGLEVPCAPCALGPARGRLRAAATKERGGS